MQSAKVINRMLLGLVAFSVSCGLGFLVNRDITQALFAGLITVPATYAGAIVVSIRQKKQINSLENEIQLIDEERIDLEDELDYLESTLLQLENQVSETYNQREILNREVAVLGGYKYQLEEQSHTLISEVQLLARREIELQRSLSSLTAEKHKTEASLNSIEKELNKKQAKITQQENEKEALEQEISNFKRQKREWEAELSTLEASIKALKQEREDLNKSLLSIMAERQNIESNLNLLQLERNQVQVKASSVRGKQDEMPNEVSKKAKGKEKLIQDISVPEKPREKLQEDLPPELKKFIKQLNKHEIQILKAIAEEDNPAATIKKIAEENITMPELLIDSINERAMNIIGDLILEPGSVSEPPVITEEYITTVKKMLQTYA